MYNECLSKLFEIVNKRQKLPPKYKQVEDYEYTEDEAIRRLKRLHK